VSSWCAAKLRECDGFDYSIHLYSENRLYSTSALFCRPERPAAPTPQPV